MDGFDFRLQHNEHRHKEEGPTHVVSTRSFRVDGSSESTAEERRGNVLQVLDQNVDSD